MTCLGKSKASLGLSGLNRTPASGVHFPALFLGFFHQLSMIKGRRMNRGINVWWNRPIK